MSASLELDATGRRRSPATMPGYLLGRPPRNKGLGYPADPPRVEEIIAVMRAAGERVHGDRVRGLIVVLWRAGLRIQKRSHSQRQTSTRVAARCSCATARATSVARSEWTTGVGST